MKRIAALTLLLVAQTATADDWDAYDVSLLAACSIVHVVDWAQTRTIARNPDKYSEKNSILGEHPSTGDVDKYFAGSLLGKIIFADLLPGKLRKGFLVFFTVDQGMAVHKNYSIGIQADW